MSNSCIICNSSIDTEIQRNNEPYLCPMCGSVNINRAAKDDFPGEIKSENEKSILSIHFRNEHEKKGGRIPENSLSIEDVKNIIKSYQPLNPIKKIENALIVLNKKSTKVGERIEISKSDYPWFHCFDDDERYALMQILRDENLIDLDIEFLTITWSGYKYLQSLQTNRDSNKCFVAMWFAPEMQQIYEDIIKPAIEYVEDGSEVPVFRAERIDNIEHLDDINDRIIAEIRRSKFMVCDLTGYRGGVYFEAGFAYGLGIPVIFTCRKDWTKNEKLFDKEKNKVTKLFDEQNNPVKIQKEGVHFDLNHRNRIEWDDTKEGLKEFKTKLTNRIKATIIP